MTKSSSSSKKLPSDPTNDFMRPILLFLLTLAPFLKAADLDDLTWEINDSEVTITNCDREASGHLDIPGEVEGFPVKYIGTHALLDCELLTPPCSCECPRLIHADRRSRRRAERELAAGTLPEAQRRAPELTRI